MYSRTHCGHTGVGCWGQAVGGNRSQKKLDAWGRDGYGARPNAVKLQIDVLTGEMARASAIFLIGYSLEDGARIVVENAL